MRLEVFSVAAWFRAGQNLTADGMIVNKGGVGVDSPGKNLNYGVWMLTNGRIKGGFELTNGTDYFITSAFAYNDGQWNLGKWVVPPS